MSPPKSVRKRKTEKRRWGANTVIKLTFGRLQICKNLLSGVFEI
ncbi:hypothetical protein [Moraxella sp. 7664RN]|nr:hypothetical protein [Moraxella sp. 7664RN]